MCSPQRSHLYMPATVFVLPVDGILSPDPLGLFPESDPTPNIPICHLGLVLRALSKTDRDIFSKRTASPVPPPKPGSRESSCLLPALPLGSLL
jgi:hypothetical protein